MTTFIVTKEQYILAIFKIIAKIYCANGKVDVEKAKKRFRLFMVKDSVKSVKGTEFPAYFDHTIYQAKFDE